MAHTLAAGQAASKGEPKALAAGRKRYQQRARERRRREAIRRVRAYQRWLKSGSKLRQIPSVPSSADFRIARGEQG